MSSAPDLSHGFFDRAQREPARPAAVTQRSLHSYRDLAGWVRGTGQALLESAIRPGERIGLAGSNDVRHLVLSMALAEAGAVPVPLHPRWDNRLKARIAEKLEVRRMIGVREAWSVEGLQFTLAGTVLGNLPTAAGAHPPAGRARQNGQIFFAPGSSGTFQPLLLDAKELERRMLETAARTELDENCRVLCGDLHYAVWAIQALATLRVGGTLVFARPNPWDQCRALAANAVTHANLAPENLSAMLKKLGEDGLHLPALKRLDIVGGDVPEALLNLVRDKLTERVYVT